MCLLNHKKKKKKHINKSMASFSLLYRFVGSVREYVTV